MRSIKFYCAFVLCFISVACGANSLNVLRQDTRYSVGLRSSYDKCGDASGGVTSAMLKCDADEYEYQNKRLNKVYVSLMSELSKNDQMKLRDEERKWIAYRNSHCSSDAEDGTASSVESSGCLVGETAKQAAALEARPGQPAVLIQYEGEVYGLHPTYMECMELTRGLGPKSLACMGDEYEYQDKRLSKAYQALMAKLSVDEKANLVANEKIWIAFRDAHCSFGADDSQARRLKLSDCLVGETAKQAFVLEGRFSFL